MGSSGWTAYISRKTEKPAEKTARLIFQKALDPRATWVRRCAGSRGAKGSEPFAPGEPGEPANPSIHACPSRQRFNVGMKLCIISLAVDGLTNVWRTTNSAHFSIMASSVIAGSVKCPSSKQKWQ